MRIREKDTEFFSIKNNFIMKESGKTKNDLEWVARENMAGMSTLDPLWMIKQTDLEGKYFTTGTLTKAK